jgi:radical SAM superfamily enzyme YgiQ (UPF0313 family)
MAAPKCKRYGPGPDYTKICLVAPRHPESFWSMKGTVDALCARTLMPNAALATLMALTPAGVSVEYTLCDENVAPIDWDVACDLVAVTGSSMHGEKVREICGRFRDRGVPVALGGTFATMEPDRARGLADHHFIGEAEHTWPLFLRQWASGAAAPLYEQKEYIALSGSPAPDWSLVDADHYVNFPVQTSRGCPNRCDFCDVIHYVGRKYRVKSVGQVMTEVRKAHERGARTVFFSDDNFYGDKKHTRELLTELVRWNSAQQRPLTFSTQITLQVGDDDEILRLLADAKFSVLFLGIESVRRQSLAEVHKEHNMNRDMGERIRRISLYGLVPFAGLIVGFDHDDTSVFGELLNFLEDTATPIAGVSLLNAPRRTQLYERLLREKRIIEYDGDWQLDTNIIPCSMTSDELFNGYWSLFKNIYEPEAFERRLVSWLEGISYFTGIYTNKQFDWKQARSGFRMFRHFLLRVQPEVRSLFFRMLKKTWTLNPRLIKRLFTTMAQYAHFYDFVNRQSRKAIP